MQRIDEARMKTARNLIAVTTARITAILMR